MNNSLSKQSQNNVNNLVNTYFVLAVFFIVNAIVKQFEIQESR